MAATTIYISYASAQESPNGFRVRYVSAEHVYIGAGSGDGVSIGDTLLIYTDNSAVAEIEAIYVAEHSSSCKIISGQSDNLEGLEVRFKHEKEAPAESTGETKLSPLPDSLETAISRPEKIPEERERTLFRGRAALQLYSFNDRGPSNLDVTQPTFRLDFQMQNPGRDLAIVVRTRTRYTERTRVYSGNVSDTEWRNRIYEASINYNNSGNGPGFRAGRIIAGSFSGVGYIDGIMAFNRLSERLETGVFVGTQPQWQYAGVQTDLQKYGAYINYSRGDRRKVRWQSTMALAAEYHMSTVSRELVHLKNRLNGGSTWSLYQSLDLDINRGWRKVKVGKSITLSNIFLSGSVSPYRWLRTSVSYDNRKRYWTYEIQSLDEQLFDDRYRRGIKADVTFYLPRHYSISLGLGYRGVEGDTDSRVSWSANMRKSNFTGLNLYYGGAYTAFSDIYSSGRRYSFNAGRYFGSSSLNLEYGNYSYDYNKYQASRSSSWVRGELFLRLSRKFYLSGSGQRGFGDDIHGDIILTELGYRF
jgi:hypothetical protein